MKRSNARAVIALALGLGLVLTLLWVMGGTKLPAAHAKVPVLSNASKVLGPDRRPLVQSSDVLTVCPAVVGTCPYSNVQAAVDAAQDGDVIKVAAGTYTGVQVRPAPAGYAGTSVITQVVYISKTLTIQGGYTTTDWSTSDPEANPTILDARGRGRVLYIAGGPSTGSGQVPSTSDGTSASGQVPSTLDGTFASGQASSALDGTSASGQVPSTSDGMSASGQAVGPTIEGFRITGGDAFGLGGHTVSGSTFDGGGGVYVYSATATLRNNFVFSNTAGAGAGLYLRNSDSWLGENIVTANVAGDGGGLYLQNSAATLEGNTVTANNASTYGGGLYLENSPATLSGNTVSSNTVHFFSGGGLYVEGSDATLSGNVIIANTGNAGGGLYLEYSKTLLRGNTVIANDGSRGGGVFLGFGDVTLINNVVADNQASSEGGGLYIFASSASLRHTTIARNGGGDGSGLHVSGSAYHETFSNVTLTNTILVSHAVGIIVAAGNTATMDATLWGSDAWANGANWGGDGKILTGTLNVQGDPAFLNAAAGDYHISLASAALDQGVDAGVDEDVDGDPRPLGSGYDIGADEVGLIVTKQADPDPVRAGARLTYTIRVTNACDVNLHATITDTLPTSVTLAETSGGTLALPGGMVGITWTAFVTAPGGVWTEQVVVTVEAGYVGPLTNRVEVTTDKGITGTASSLSAVNVTVHLPLVTRRWPPIPHRPILDPIDNTDGDDSYVVSWTEQPVRLAITYTLQEAIDAGFTTDLRDVCTTSELSCSVSGNLPGTYYYHVRGHNAWGTSAWSNVQTAVVPYTCPVTSSNQYTGGIAFQHDDDDPVRPARDHADKNLELRGYAPNTDPEFKRELVDYGTGVPIQPPQLATLFDPYRVPTFGGFYRVHNWNWAPSPDPGSRGSPITAWPVTALGLHTTPGETLYVPASGYDIGDGMAVIVLFADEDTVTLRYAREDSAAPSGYTVHIDNICTDPNLLTLYNSLDDPEGPRYVYVPSESRPYSYNLPNLPVGQPLGTARDTEIVVAVVDTGSFMDTRSCDEWWQIRPGYAGTCPPP